MPISRIEDIISTEMALQRIPGISIAIGSEGDVVYARGFGDRDVANRDAMAAGTVYPIASISKQFTAAMVLLLAERGRLSIDDPINQYFPGLAAWNGVSVQHLLGQTSGIPGMAGQRAKKYRHHKVLEGVRFVPRPMSFLVLFGCARRSQGFPA